MSDYGLTPDALKRRYEEEVVSKAKTFATQGVGQEAARNFLDTAEGELYLDRLYEASPTTPLVDLRQRAIDQITSGRDLPRMETLTEPLVKIVPKGIEPSPYSPYWAKQADLDAALKEGKNLSQHFGLPISSEAARYDVYKITPKAPTEVFVSTVAPTSELGGQVTKPGGATQCLTPNRNLYGPHEFVKTVDNQLLHAPIVGRGLPATVKAAGALGAAYGAYDAKGQVDAAIASATSTKDQWVKGGAELANQTSKTAVTGGAAAAGAVPGAAAGALTSPVTGPAGAVVGGLATGTAAALAAEKAYENSRLQTWSKAAGAAVGEVAYEHLSTESRLHKAVQQAQAAAGAETDPIKQAGLQAKLEQARSAWGGEVQSNNRHFEGKGAVENQWDLVQSRFPRVDKADVVGELDRHLSAGKTPAEAARAAINNSVNAHYPRSLMQVPLEDVTQLSTEQLQQRFAAAAGSWAKEERQVQAWEANKDSRNDLDAGWPKELAQKRHAERVEGGRAQAWKDMGVLGAIHDEIKARGLDPRTVLPQLSAESPTGLAKDLAKDTTKDTTKAATKDTTKDATQEPLRLTPEQQRQWERVETQVGPGLRERGLNPEQVQRVVAASLAEAQAHPERGPIKSVLFSKDGQSLGVMHADGRFGEVQISEALGKSKEQHLGAVHPSNQVAGQAQQAPRQDGAAAPAPEPSAPEPPTPEVPARARR